MTDARPSEWRQLIDWCAAFGLHLARAQIDQLQAYLDVLQLWNRKLSLVAQTDPAQILWKHFADSLFVAGQCADRETLVDLGSGAGFPCLPIAIARPALRARLIESRGKKASFLEQACHVASIHNATVFNARIEMLSGQASHRGCCTVVTERALTDNARFLALAMPFLRPGGRAIAMRSVHEPFDPALEEIRYELPDGTPRRLLIARP
jgi:16S rRNA (guanine527-N7)-methyltransferase